MVLFVCFWVGYWFGLLCLVTLRVGLNFLFCLGLRTGCFAFDLCSLVLVLDLLLVVVGVCLLWFWYWCVLWVGSV